MNQARQRKLLALDMERYGHVAIWNRETLTGVHSYATGQLCPHHDCGASGTGDVTGYQCAECGHYFPASRVRFSTADSEPYCRAGMGHNHRGRTA